MISIVDLSITGNEIFDFYFAVPSIFAVGGWSVGIIIGLIRRVIR